MDLLQMGRAGMHLMFEVRRNTILDDALRVINKPNLNFKKPLRVIFAGEPGVDEGGVRKEFFQLLIKDLLNPDYAMFQFNEKAVLYYINGLSHEPNINFELIGVLMGLAIYNNIILDVSFPQAIYKLLLFEEPDFDDLREWQPDIAQSLEFILNYNDPDNPLEDALGTSFSIEVENFGEKMDVELKPGGSTIFVNEQNRE
jgi:E3 ubiquitin-protein ligase HERC4